MTPAIRVLCVGARDHRFECQHCKINTMWPLPLLIWRDLESPLLKFGMSLKEIVAVTSRKYTKAKTKVDQFVPTASQVDKEPHHVDHLPIVHDILLIYVKKDIAAATRID